MDQQQYLMLILNLTSMLIRSEPRMLNLTGGKFTFRWWRHWGKGTFVGSGSRTVELAVRNMYKLTGTDTTNCGILRNIFSTSGAIFLKLLNVLVRTPKPSNVHCFCHWIWILHDLTSMRRGTWHWLESPGAKKLSRYLLTLKHFARQNQQHPQLNQLWLHDSSCEKYQQQ